MEFSSQGIHVVPNDISAITEQTDWSFIGVKDGAIMFEAESVIDNTDQLSEIAG
jgi:hypothetical protein